MVSFETKLGKCWKEQNFLQGIITGQGGAPVATRTELGEKTRGDTPPTPLFAPQNQKAHFREGSSPEEK